MDFFPSTLKLSVCENVMKFNWKEIVSLQFKCMQHWKNEIWKSDKAFKLRKTEMKMKFRNCWNANEMLQNLKCKRKFAKNLKWNFIWNSLKIALKESCWLQWKSSELAKISQRSGGWLSQNNLQVATVRPISAITVFLRCHPMEN